MGLKKMLIRDALVYKDDEKTGQFAGESKFYHDSRIKQQQCQTN